MTEKQELAHFLKAAQEAARRGAAILQQWRTKFAVREKGRFDLVTDADFASQQAVYEHLHQCFPDHAFLGEENNTPALRPGPSSPPTWIADPLDGTTNYVHDFPFYCVSIGLQMAGELVVGVVFDPSRQEMFSAVRGQGAWLNEQRLQVSPAPTLDQALLATGFPPDLRGHERTLKLWEHLSYRAQSLRRTGSTALNLAYVAAGRFDGYWGFDNHPWDVAGGAVLVKEAGGRLSRADGSPFDPFTPDSVAGNPVLHPLLLAEVSQVA